MPSSPRAVRRGRPPKFGAPARPVTLSLPEHVIDALHGVDADLSRAVVRLAQPILGEGPHAPAELATFGSRSIIVVNPTQTLARRAGVDLIHLPDGRALIAFDEAMNIPELELIVTDAREDPRLSVVDREVFAAVADILKTARRSDDRELVQRNIIVVEARRPKRPAGRKARDQRS